MYCSPLIAMRIQTSYSRALSAATKIWGLIFKKTHHEIIEGTYTARHSACNTQSRKPASVATASDLARRAWRDFAVCLEGHAKKKKKPSLMQT
jgi:hypothetical protein